MDGARTALQMLQDSHTEQTSICVRVRQFGAFANAEVVQIQKNCVKVSGLASVMLGTNIKAIFTQLAGHTLQA